MKTFEIVQSDQFDRRDLTQMLDVAPRLRAAVDDLGASSPTGRDLGADLWSSLIRFSPQKTTDVPPSHRVNEKIIDRIWEAEQYRDLHQHTVGDPVNTTAGLCALSSKVTGMLSELADVNEQAQKAQDAQDALDDAMNGAGDGGSDGGGEDGADLEDLRSQAQAESELLDEMLDEQLPRIDSAVRSALNEAAADADQQAAVAAGWDLSPGDATRMDPAARIKLMDRLNNDRMRRIADLLGAMTNLAIGQRDRRFELRPGELHGVTLGRSLARLIPAEMAALAVPELEDLLMLRLIQGRARNYLTRSVERVGRGAIVYLEDCSGSMEGAKADWSKAVGLALLRIARQQDRAFHAICFHGKDDWERFDFPNAKAAVTEQMLDFASTRPSGGTEITGPLDEAVRLLEDEYAHAGHIEGDLILATDGEVGVPAEWLTRFRETQERLQFHTYGLAVRARLSTLTALCTHIADIADLTSGRDLTHVFETVQ